MSGRKILFSAVLVAFAALTLEAVVAHGYLGFFELALANRATQLLALDLVITLSLVAVWMVMDARKRQTSVVPYLAVTLAFGAAGPLLYLLRRPAETSESSA